VLGGVFAGLVLLATRVLPLRTPVAVAAATLAAAALFNPLRRRVQLRPAAGERCRAAEAGKTAGVDRWVLHVDLDQFIAAVEVLRRPELRGKPVVVGGDGDPAKRGVVSTASYEARTFGVHSGQPLRTAAKRCPDCVFLPVDADAYHVVSARVMAVLRDTGQPVEVLGWDEAFVGVETGDPETFARDLAADVRAATRLDCSIGIGENKLQAKIATGFGKPAGVFRLTSATWFELLGDRPPDAIWGIGAKTTAKLSTLGITTVRELAGADPDRLAKEFGPMTGPWLVLLGRGRGDAEVDPTPYVARSHGREVTFQRNIADWAEVTAEVARLAGQVAAEVDRPVARVVVKVRYAPFVTITHGVPLTGAFDEAALAALALFEPGRPVRLLGVRAEFADVPD
jgi:nucleotidyltransferase/DNA polymerase involved in DNA repair